MTDVSKPTPIACTLETGEFQECIAGIADLNREALRSQRRDGLRLELTYAPAALDRAREIVAREQKCCPFLTFDLREEKDAVRLVMEAPQAARDIVDAVFEPFQARISLLIRSVGATNAPESPSTRPPAPPSCRLGTSPTRRS
jgi:hypothetical protein